MGSACGGEDRPAPDDGITNGETNDSGTNEGALLPPPDREGFQLALSWSVGPGEEKTHCALRAMPPVPDGEGPYVTAFEHSYTENASHHLLLYTTALTASDVLNYPGLIEDCAGLDQGARWCSLRRFFSHGFDADAG